MTLIGSLMADGVLPALKHFVSTTKLHPVLVNFTAALVPVSVGSDLASRLYKRDSLRETGWWTLLIATVITPFTALAGWLFWMPDDDRATGMAIHKWLGTALAIILFGLFAWRRHYQRRQETPSLLYFLAGAIFIAALIVQGTLGGNQTFSGM